MPDLDRIAPDAQPAHTQLRLATCDLCGVMGQGVALGLAEWTDVTDLPAWSAIYRCRDGIECRDRVEAQGRSWPLRVGDWPHDQTDYRYRPAVHPRRRGR